MTTRLGTIIITNLFIVLNVAYADVKPFVGVGGVGQNAFHNWCVDELFHDPTPPVFSTGLYFEAGMKWKQLELYAGYRSTNSQTQRFSHGTGIESYHVDNIYYSQYRYYTKEESWGERRFLIGMRHRLTLKDYPIVPVVGIAVEIGEDINRWFSRERDYFDVTIYDDSSHYVGSNHYESSYNHDGDRKRVPSYGGLIEIGVEWKIVDHISVLILTQAGITEAEDKDSQTVFNTFDDVLTVSQMFQLRYTL
jgi:hypothetical protein